MSSKCIHVVTTHEPAELVQLTRPLFEEYAQRIGAELRFISERKFPNYPPNYERMQVFEAGRSFAWNMVVDASVLLGPLLPDFTRILDRRCIGLCLHTHAPNIFAVAENKYFVRDGRDLGVVAAIMVTSQITHDVWEPLAGQPNEWLPHIKSGDPAFLSELCLSLNTAKYRFDVLNPFGTPAQLYRVDGRDKPTDAALMDARSVLQSWGVKA